MITYVYWGSVFLAVIGILFGLGVKLEKWKAGIIMGLIVLIAGWGAYYFHFEQLFVKRYGGVMSLSVPEGQVHISATWKGDNLWIENYDPKTDRCIFSEYSKGNLLEGRVIIKNCNPLVKNR
ncbi:MAG: hypothetical protein H6681_00935 [Desulfobacteraceae bacterium]|nr:hypothetical protein [Desulfobacteraceae bacterium]